MKRVGVLLSAALISSLAAPHLFAATIKEIYQQAVKNNDTFKSAEYAYKETKEALPLAYANLLPQVSASYSYNQENVNSDPVQTQTKGYEASVTQAIFNWSDIANIKTAKATVMAGLATYLQSEQTLIYTVIDDYITVIDDLQFLNIDNEYYKRLQNIYNGINKQITKIQSQSTARTETASVNNQHNNVEVLKKDLTDIQSMLDKQSLQILTDQQDLNKSLEALCAETHGFYTSFYVPTKVDTLENLSPKTLKKWVAQTKQFNLTVKAAQATVLSAKAALSGARGAHLPTVSLDPTYSSYDSKYQGIPAANRTTKSVALTVSLPIFSGGSMIKQTQQDKYALASAQASLDAAIQSAVTTTITDFMEVKSTIQSFNASGVALASAKKSYIQTKAGYQNGTNNIFQLIDRLQTFVAAKKTKLNNLTSYFTDLATLKEQVGIISVNDINFFNKFFVYKVQLPKSIIKFHQIY